MKIRKIISVIDESHSEAGRNASPPLRKVAVAAVCRNPRVGAYSDRLDDLIDGSRKCSPSGVGSALSSSSIADEEDVPSLAPGDPPPRVK